MSALHILPPNWKALELLLRFYTVIEEHIFVIITQHSRKGPAMAWAVNRRPSTAEARLQLMCDLWWME